MAVGLREDFAAVQAQLQQAIVEKKDLAAQLAIAVAEGGKPSATKHFAGSVWGKPISPHQFWHSPGNVDGAESPDKQQ